MLTKGSDDTANAEDGDEAVRPVEMWLVVEGKEEKEKKSEGVSGVVSKEGRRRKRKL